MKKSVKSRQKDGRIKSVLSHKKVGRKKSVLSHKKVSSNSERNVSEKVVQNEGISRSKRKWDLGRHMSSKNDIECRENIA